MISLHVVVLQGICHLGLSTSPTPRCFEDWPTKLELELGSSKIALRGWQSLDEFAACESIMLQVFNSQVVGSRYPLISSRQGAYSSGNSSGTLGSWYPLAMTTAS
ncbi:hypothetical protein Hypma_006800 [Hypsizygus marmoreus]|uniref:Uncharacterized protein n=1 Tax=Hypsizygus marmoreus TaxID=39966 RepID=A0A369JX10_HYPMA|nr:hypothetical protein Hypma_006800 [Hypsizygus marmoreus]